ncbi:hypothetical protein [Endozoicomonas acroporae]|uniref:hypothetical protein n=1 Tax=Endozoicomonas acroporae TaxID=1701104 RepID=UPI003D792E98
MNAVATEQILSEIAKENLDINILEGKVTGLNEQAMESIVKAMMAAYSAGYQAQQQDQ